MERGRRRATTACPPKKADRRFERGYVQMEVVLLWLDEIDDLLFILALSWERLRRSCLAAGLLAAFMLAAGELAADAALWDEAATWTPRFGAIAGASVGVWLGSVLASLVRRLTPA